MIPLSCFDRFHAVPWTSAYWEHFRESAFLYGRWERTLREGLSPLVHFVDGLDERFLANEEALTLAPSNQLASAFEEALDDPPDKGGVVALSLAMVGSGTAALEEQVLSAMESHPQHMWHIMRALELSWRDPTPLALRRLRETKTGSVAAALLYVLAERSHRFGAELQPYLQDTAAEVRAAALRCATNANIASRPWIEQALDDPNLDVRDAAREAFLGLDIAASVSELRRAFDHRADRSDLVTTVLAITTNAEDIDRLQQGLHEPEHRRQVVWALSFSGSPHVADLCLDLMGDEDVADLAAEAFQSITGIRVRTTLVPSSNGGDRASKTDQPWQLPRTRWRAPAPAGDTQIDHDTAAAVWQAQKRSRAPVRGRMLGGAPLTGTTLVNALRSAPLRQRHVRALELGLRSGGRARVKTLNWGWHQLETLKALKVPEPLWCDVPLEKAAH